MVLVGPRIAWLARLPVTAGKPRVARSTAGGRGLIGCAVTAHAVARCAPRAARCTARYGCCWARQTEGRTRGLRGRVVRANAAGGAHKGARGGEKSARARVAHYGGVV